MSKDTFYKIYSGDYSKEGYDQGIDDAKQSRPKNKFKFFKAVNPINLLWNTNNALDSFNQSYNKGYIDGQRVSHNIYHSTQGAGSAMQSVDNYTNHLRMLDEVETVIQSLKCYVQEMEVKYKQQIDAAESTGFMQDYTEQLKQKQQRFAAKIDALQGLIENHNAKIAQQKNIIQQLKNVAQNSTM